MIELVPLIRQFQGLRDEIIKEIGETIDSGQYVIGPKGKRLEGMLADYMNVSHGIGVANGTDALVLVLDAYGIGPGDEVITSPFTFFATAEAISRVGATPVFADVDPVTFNLDPKQVEKKVTPATKAILPVHLFGMAADMDELAVIAGRHNLRLIEDACQAFGAEYKGRRVGSLGDAACFSFFPTKNLGTAGDGGFIATSDGKLAERIRQLRQHGSRQKYYHETIGYNSRLDELHAAILLVFFPHIDEWNRKRRSLAERYREGLKTAKGIRVPDENSAAPSIYHLFCIETDDQAGMRKKLDAAGIQSGVYYPLPLHLQEAYRPLGYRAGDFPVAEELCGKLLAIPMSPYLLEDEQDQVIAVLLREKEERADA